jgi:cytochrome c biogenesis factor
MLNVAYPILLIMVPLLFAILIGLKISEIQNKKTILWKMPLTSATTAIILAIIGYVWVIIDQKINGCVELDCLAPIFLLFAAIVYILVIFLISYFMALIFYYTNKFKRKNL